MKKKLYKYLFKYVTFLSVLEMIKGNDKSNIQKTSLVKPVNKLYLKYLITDNFTNGVSSIKSHIRTKWTNLVHI